MRVLFDLIKAADKDLSDNDLNAIIQVGNEYVYAEGDADSARVICSHLASFGKRLLVQERLFQSYCMYILAIKFLAATDWSSKQILLSKAIRATVAAYPEQAQASAYELISIISNANKLPDENHNQPHFIADLHYLGNCFAAKAKDPACPHYKSIAVLLYELVIKHGTPVNYVNLSNVKATQTPLKVNQTIGELLLLSETYSSDENLNAIIDAAKNNVYTSEQAEVANYVFIRLELQGQSLFKEKRFDFSSKMYTSCLFYISLTDLQNWLNTLLNAITAAISSHPDKAIPMVEKFGRAIDKNYSHIVPQSAMTMDRLLHTAKYFVDVNKQNIDDFKYRDAALILLESICKLNFKSGKAYGFARMNDVVLLKNKLKRDKATLNLSPNDKTRFERKNLIFLGINVPPKTKAEPMTDEPNRAQHRPPASSRSSLT